MLSLLFMAAATAAADSLNPVAVTQQFVLQGLVKRPRHIWFYIGGVGGANLLGGLLAYFGLAALLGRFWQRVLDGYSRQLFTAELILGIFLVACAGCLFMGRKLAAIQSELRALQGENEEAQEESALKRRVKSVRPVHLCLLGAAAAVSELPTALPYFAFLAVLLNSGTALPAALLLLFLYNVIYCLPLMLLYALYLRFRSGVDRVYRLMKAKISKYIGAVTAVVVGGVGVLLIFHAMGLLL